MEIGRQQRRQNNLMRQFPTQIRRQICRVRQNSNESNRSSQSARNKKEEISAYQKFYVKMATPEIDLSNSLYSDSTLMSHDSEPEKKGYKRSSTPYRTEKQKEQRLKQQLKQQPLSLNPVSLQQQLDKQSQLLRLEQQNHDLQRSIIELQQKNHQLLLTVSTLRQRINQLEEEHRSLQDQLISKLPRTPIQPPTDQKSKKLSDLKKMIRQTRKMELQAQKQHHLKQIQSLKSKLTSSEQHAIQLHQQLKFKVMIIRNYETAASLPTAKQHQLNQQIRQLKQQLSKHNFQHFLEQQNHWLKNRVTCIEQQLKQMHLKLRCKQQMYQREKQIIRNKCDQKEAKTRSNLKQLIRLFTKYQQENPKVADENPLQLSLSFDESI